jgi:hypothetical protein
VNAHAVPDELLLDPVFIHQGQYPLYDVEATFAELPRKAFEISGENRNYHVGNMVPGLPKMTSFRLPHHGKDFNFDFKNLLYRSE